MEQTLYRIGEASASLGLHDKNSNTLRSWVEEFSSFLGASANPETGRPRFFTEDDLRVLRTVRDLRANHLPYAEIRERLEQGTHAVERPTTVQLSEQSERPSTKESALVTHDHIQSLLAPITRAAEEWRLMAEQYRARLEDREARVTSLEDRIDSLQRRLEDLATTSLNQRHPLQTPGPTPTPSTPKRRRLWGLLD